MKTAQMLVLAAGLIAATGCTSTRTQLGYAKPVKLDDLPAPAQTAVRQELGNATIKRITQETKYGRPAYRVEVSQSWVNPTLWVNSEGAIIKESDRLVAQRRNNVNEAAGAQAPAKQAEPTPAPAPAPSPSNTNTNSMY